MQESLNHARLAMLFRRQYQLCDVQKGETIVLLSDLGARRDYVAAASSANSSAVSSHPIQASVMLWP